MNKMSYTNMFNNNNQNLSTEISYSYEAINESLKSIFYVNQGELLGDPMYGSKIRTYLFELKTQTSISEIKDMIASDIAKYVPTIIVDVEDIHIYTNPNNTQYKITIAYKINKKSQYSYFETILS